jgi:outer membrane protein
MSARRFVLSAALIAGCWVGSLRGATATALSLPEARALALKMHPHLTVVELQALAAKEVVTETRAGFFPTLSANATAVGAGESVTRLAASGTLSNSQIYDRVGVGATVAQLITDFGRTSNLTEAAKLRTRAAEANVQTVRSQLLLAVDTAYFAALKARSVRAVASKVLANRQLLSEQIGALAKNKLKSELDVRFTEVSVAEARLLADQADSDWQSALATLSDLLGQKTRVTADLSEVPASPEVLPSDAEPLTDLALRQRPELQRQRSERDAARDTAQAAQDSRRPTISAIGAAGVVPIRDEHFEHDYAAAGVNVNLPLFAGGLYRARQREAELQAEGADALLREQEDDVVRDVRIAWLEAGHARDRIALTASLLESASATLDLAHVRFDQGLSSIVELNQAELSQVSAEIAHTTAEYDYRVRRDILDYQTGSLR